MLLTVEGRSILDTAPAFFGDPACLALELGGSNATGTARAVARLFGMLANDGGLDGVKLLRSETVALFSTEQGRGPDRMTGHMASWALGFARRLPGPSAATAFWWGPHADSFGVDGYGGQMGFADPVSRVGVGFVRSELSETSPLGAELVRALYACLERDADARTTSTLKGSSMLPDPATFDPEVAREWDRFSPHESLSTDVASARATLNAFFQRVASRPTAQRTGVTVEDRSVPSLIDDHAIPVRVYRPAEPVNGRALVHLHGGAFYLGDLEMEDESCRIWAREAGCVVVAVDYRLAPEHTYPAPLEDCYSALCWVADNTAELDIDSQRVGVSGISAGGALAAGVCLLARDRKGPELALQMLLYPVLDAAGSSPAMSVLSADDRGARARMWEQYLGCPSAEAPVYASPASADDLQGLPSAYVACAQFDLLRDEAIIYTQRLVNAGVSAELHLWPRVPHTFELVVPDTGLARRSTQEQVEAIARFLG